MSTQLPTAREALAAAVAELQRVDGDVEHAKTWVSLAREIREGSTAPEQPADRLTLHDVEGIVCGHGRVAIRRRLKRKGDQEALWWRHADGDATVCDDVQQETEHDRREKANITWTFSPAATYDDAPTAVAERAYAADGERAQQLPGSSPDTPAVIDLPDNLVGYQRGQMLNPTQAQVTYADQLAARIQDGKPPPYKIPERSRGALVSLVHEILSRPVLLPAFAAGDDPQTTRSDLENTAVLSTRVRVSPARPATTPPPTHGVCVNDGLDIHLIASASGEAPRYAHDVSGQSVCPEQRSPEGHETFVHRFAWPAPQG